jgi:hypothetical protein
VIPGQWKDQAACKGMDEHLFFPTTGGGGSGKLSAALAACQRCPVLTECRAEPLKWVPRHRWGLWGGVMWRGCDKPTDYFSSKPARKDRAS